MKLTLYTDYSIRVLIHLGAVPQGELVTLKDISATYDISINHLMKIVQTLRKEKYISTVRGRNGGIQLAQCPEEIHIGDLVRKLEGLNMIEASEMKKNQSTLAFGFILEHAVDHFLEALNKYTLKDLIHYIDIEKRHDEIKQAYSVL